MTYGSRSFKIYILWDFSISELQALCWHDKRILGCELFTVMIFSLKI
jgi:hypothetical protein